MNIIDINKQSSEKDLQGCVVLLLHQMTFIGSPSTKEKVEKGLRLALELPRVTKVFAAKSSSGEIVGILFGNKGASIEKAGYYFWINELYIKDTERSKGLGTALLQGAIDWCKGHKIKGVNLCAAMSNESAKHLYTKFGFEGERMFLFNKVLTE